MMAITSCHCWLTKISDSSLLESYYSAPLLSCLGVVMLIKRRPYIIWDCVNGISNFLCVGYQAMTLLQKSNLHEWNQGCVSGYALQVVTNLFHHVSYRSFLHHMINLKILLLNCSNQCYLRRYPHLSLLLQSCNLSAFL